MVLINKPGGVEGFYDSVLWRALRETHEKKPVTPLTFVVQEFPEFLVLVFFESQLQQYDVNQKDAIQGHISKLKGIVESYGVPCYIDLRPVNEDAPTGRDN